MAGKRSLSWNLTWNYSLFSDFFTINTYTMEECGSQRSALWCQQMSPCWCSSRLQRLPRSILCQGELPLYTTAIDSGTTHLLPGLITCIFVTQSSQETPTKHVRHALVWTGLWLCSSGSELASLQMCGEQADLCHTSWHLPFPPDHPSFSKNLLSLNVLRPRKLKLPVSFLKAYSIGLQSLPKTDEALALSMADEPTNADCENPLRICWSKLHAGCKQNKYPRWEWPPTWGIMWSSPPSNTLHYDSETCS